MKTRTNSVQTGLMLTGILATTALWAGGCATMTKPEEELSAMGPSVVNVKTRPTTVELNRDLNPYQKPEIVADVKDFKSPIREVKLEFERVPIQIPMENIGGTTWRGTLTTKQLQSLAVGGKTMSYDAKVVARNENGQVGMSEDSVKITIKTPELGKYTG